MPAEIKRIVQSPRFSLDKNDPTKARSRHQVGPRRYVRTGRQRHAYNEDACAQGAAHAHWVSRDLQSAAAAAHSTNDYCLTAQSCSKNAPSQSDSIHIADVHGSGRVGPGRVEHSDIYFLYAGKFILLKWSKLVYP